MWEKCEFCKNVNFLENVNFENVNFVKKWEFENVNSVKSDIFKMWIFG